MNAQRVIKSDMTFIIKVDFNQNFEKVVQFYLIMMYHIGMEKTEKIRTLTKEEMRNIVTGGIAISNAATYKRINKMISDGKISRVATGQYTLDSKERFSYSLESKTANKVFNCLTKKLNKSANFIVYESTLLNLFLNHLIANSTVIVEVEKDLLEQIYWLLKDEGFKNVLLKPDENENYIYNPFNGEGVIVKSLVSKSPINKKEHKTTIEKLVVDIVIDKTINMFFEEAEKKDVVSNIFEKYAIKFDSVRNYAKRRHSLDRFLDYVPVKYISLFYD